MLKKLHLLLFVSIALTSYGQNVTATIKTVSTVEPGKDFTVEINVNKTGVSGFMKFFQELPAGYTPTDIDSKGGNFTFADNGAKIIWITPPTTDLFTISYKITSPASGQGSISIGGKFSYVLGNERKSFDLVQQVITVGKAGSALVAAETPKPTPVEEKPVVTETPKPTPVEEKPVATETPKPSPVEEKPVATETPKPTPVEEKPKPVETKKEPAPVVSNTPAKTPTTAAVANTPGRTYRVQIGAFNLKPTIKGVPEQSTVLLDNGMTKYFSGNFKTYEEAVKRKKEMLDKGFVGAFIVGFENGKIIK